MPISETKERIAFLVEHKCLPYVMRDIACWASEKRNFYIDLAAWANQPSFFKKMSFPDFLEKRHVKQERVNFSKEIFRLNIIYAVKMYIVCVIVLYVMSEIIEN